MGRSLASFYNPVLAVHAPARSSEACSAAAPTTADTRAALSANELVRPLKWREAPFDIEEEREDAVYEAFISSDGSTLPSPTAGQLGSSLPLSTPLDNDAPSPLDFSDCLDGPPGPPDDSHYLHPNAMLSQPPMTPSSAVFHTMTLPLQLPAPHERIASRRGNAANPSMNISVSSSSTEHANASLHRLAPPPFTTPGISPPTNATNNHDLATSPVQFSLPPAPRWSHRQPPAISSPMLSRSTSRPWEVDESAPGHWDVRRSLLQAEFSRLLEQLRTDSQS